MEETPYPLDLPLFPLTGVLLLPGAHIPLNVFESRYRNMIEDVIGEAPFIGLIQPKVPKQDNQPDLSAPIEHPQLYGIGCVGQIDHLERLDDGRFITLVKGVQRFRCQEELPLHRGYRRMRVDYEDFIEDRDEHELEIDASRLLNALQSFATVHQIQLEFDRLSKLSGHTLLNSMAMALPFEPAEKQALLEAPSVDQRYDILLTLMNMGLDLPNEQETEPSSSLPN